MDSNIIKDIVQYGPDVRKALAEIITQVEKEIDNLVIRVTRTIRLTIRQFKNSAQEAFDSIFPMLDDAFTVDSQSKLQEMAAIYGEDLAGALYEVQLKLLGLQEAIIRAAAPLAQLLLPFVNMAIDLLTKLANTVGQIMEAFFGGSAGAKEYASSLYMASGATKALERSLAGFDQIQRLGSKNTGLGSILVPQSQTVLPGWQTLVDQVLVLLEPLKAIDFSPVVEGLKKLYQAAKPIVKTLFDGLEWAWYNIFVPMAQWAATEVLPAFLEALTKALELFNQVIEALRPAFTWLWENCLEKLMYWYADKVITDIQAITDKLQGVSDWITDNSYLVQSVLGFLDDAVLLFHRMTTETDFWVKVGIVLNDMLKDLHETTTSLPTPLGFFLGLLDAFAPVVGRLTGCWEEMLIMGQNAFYGIKSVWDGAWGWLSETVISPMESGVKTAINHIIGNFESMVGAVASAFNSVSRAVNASSFYIPSWVPEVGGMEMRFQIPDIVRPQIPRLATGAVLPANKPFLAMVGDQTHGTNVEAPLSTIQEALDLTLADRLEGMMAGFHAVTARQEQILEAILNLDVSDGAIYGAVDRYQRKMAVVTGG